MQPRRNDDRRAGKKNFETNFPFVILARRNFANFPRERASERALSRPVMLLDFISSTAQLISYELFTTRYAALVAPPTIYLRHCATLVTLHRNISWTLKQPALKSVHYTRAMHNRERKLSKVSNLSVFSRLLQHNERESLIETRMIGLLRILSSL